MGPTHRRLSLIALLAMVMALTAELAPLAPDRTVSAIETRQQDTAAPSPGTGPITLTSFVRVVDGQSIDAVIDGRRVAIAVDGIEVPKGNTRCGKQATDLLKSLAKAARGRGGLRLVDDPSETLDARG